VLGSHAPGRGIAFCANTTDRSLSTHARILDRKSLKVFIQVPCLNEEETLPAVLESIPTQIDGVDEIEILVIDDGSSHRTLDVAREHGVTHFVHHTRNMGLARSFRDGVDYALAHGADIVVNTDGDNQYPQDRIGDLVKPIIAGDADIVIADRQTTNAKTRESRLFKNAGHPWSSRPRRSCAAT
jgi:glycosyltransferase involved in cell wall biosynthesis